MTIYYSSPRKLIWLQVSFLYLPESRSIFWFYLFLYKSGFLALRKIMNLLLSENFFFKIAINLVKYGTLTGSLWRLRNESQKMDGNEWQSSQSKAGPIRPLSVTGVGARLRNCPSLMALDSIQRHCRGCTCFQAPGHWTLPPQPWWSLSPCFLALWDVNPVLRGHSWLS